MVFILYIFLFRVYLYCSKCTVKPTRYVLDNPNECYDKLLRKTTVFELGFRPENQSGQLCVKIANPDGLRNQK